MGTCFDWLFSCYRLFQIILEYAEEVLDEEGFGRRRPVPPSAPSIREQPSANPRSGFSYNG
jgi:hypothetical protein